jgi:hypothetical protein
MEEKPKMTATVSDELDREKVEQLEQKVGEFLQEHSEIEMIVPVVVGLLITSQFRLRGTRALLVNLLVASATRQILGQLKTLSPAPTLADKTPQSSPNLATAETESEYAIVHSVPGRVRLRLPHLRSDALFAKRLETLLNAEERVLKARVNRAAACIAINYEAQGLSDWELGALLLSILQTASRESTEVAA